MILLCCCGWEVGAYKAMTFLRNASTHIRDMEASRSFHQSPFLMDIYRVHSTAYKVQSYSM